MLKVIRIFVLLVPVMAYGQQQDTTDLSQLLQLKAETEATELQKKLNENVAAASRKALSSRETPGIVSVVTADDIRNSGARDLIDVLRLVPGFDFASDVNFVTGLTLRGAWSIEGKVLVLLDGLELNDLLYQNVAFFNRFPVDLIHRIEIIRGPGSAVFGGTAAYGVINIVTRGQASEEGLVASMQYGGLPDSYGRRNGQLSVGKSFGKDGYVDISVYGGEAVKSDQDYQDLYGDADPVNLTDIATTRVYAGNVGLKLRDFSFRALFENYENGDPSIITSFQTFSMTARNEFRIGEELTVTPFVDYSRQRPWKQEFREDGTSYYDILATRIKGGVSGSYDVSRRINLVAGTEYLADRAQSDLDPVYFGGDDETRFTLYSFYAQALLKHHWVNITGGFRFDNHSSFGSAFVPRLALTKRIENLHFKVLASGSYRAPGIDNINLGEDIKPERSIILELELGYQLTPDMLLSLNAYHIRTRDIIVYFYQDLGGGEYEDGYENNSRFGTKGLELVYLTRQKRWTFEANYSYYHAVENTVDRYAVPGRDDLYIGAPRSKFTVLAGFDITPDLRINMTANRFSERYAYTRLNADGLPETDVLPSYLLVNTNVSYQNLFTKGLTLAAGLYDVLNERAAMPQAYNGDVAPLSGRSREWTVKLGYQIPFKREK